MEPDPTDWIDGTNRKRAAVARRSPPSPGDSLRLASYIANVPKTPAISTTFDEGRYFDLWMLVHFMGGVTGGFSNLLFSLSTANVYVVGIALMTLWEIGEYARGIREQFSNRVLDIAVGLGGVALAVWLTAHLDDRGRVAALVVSGVLFGGGSLLGWLAYRRRDRDSTLRRPR